MANRGAGARRIAARMWWLALVPFGVVTDRGSRSRWLLMPAVVIFTALTSSLGKLIVRRPRPGSTHPVPWGRLGPAGFPSTHSACAFAIASWLRRSRHGRRLHAVAILIGYSRVRCRAHHSADVAAGAVLGYALGRQLDRLWPRRSTAAQRRRTRKRTTAGERSRLPAASMA